MMHGDKEQFWYGFFCGFMAFLAIILFLAYTTPASASSLNYARAAWSSPNACSGSVQLVVEDLPADRVAEARWLDPGVGALGFYGCTIAVDPAVPRGWRRRCVIVHEYGHLLLGTRHIERRSSIMQSSYEAMLEAPSCRRIRRATSPR